MAYAIARAPDAWRTRLLLLVILPFWTSFLIRVYAWIGLLKGNGLINNALMNLGLVHEPLALLNNAFSVQIGFVYSYLPYMILPLYASLEKLDWHLLEAAADLGARPFSAFLSVTLPLSLPGIAAGALLVFIPMVGEFVIPDLLGRARQSDDRQGAVGRVLHQPRLAGGGRGGGGDAGAADLADGKNPPPLGQGGGMTKRLSPFLLVMLALGYLFLYGPIVSVVVYSFNASRLVTVWAGFSTRWYGELLHNEQIKDAALVSLSIALMSATGALILGTLAGYGLARFARFRGRALFAVLTTSPLVLPEVITGLSLLLLFVALERLIGWPAGRGMLTITIAHITLGLSYVAIIVAARLESFDIALEEAALDLGARPFKVFAVITLPLIAPALGGGLAAGVHAVARRSGHRQLHHRPGGDDLADGDLLQRAHGRQPADQRAGDADPAAGGGGGDRGEPADEAEKLRNRS